MKLALIVAGNGRDDVYRVYEQGKVWVGNELVTKWNVMLGMMQFRGEGKDVRETYKKLIEETKGLEDDFSD